MMADYRLVIKLYAGIRAGYSVACSSICGCYFMRIGVILVLLLTPVLAQAQNTDSNERVGNYRTREERREAGLGTELTEWLSFSGLLETEIIREVTEFDGPLADHRDDEVDPAVQAAFDVDLFDIFEAELIFEYSEDPRAPLMDEFILATDIGDIGLSAGRFYLPFGIYYSHFINGPMIEFAETRSDVVQLDYDWQDQIEFSLYAYDPHTREVGGSDSGAGWGAAIDAKLMNGRLNIGGGYLSNVADSEEQFLRGETANQYLHRVSAWNAYLVYEADHWDVSLETVQSSGRFAEFDPPEDQPRAWNIEASYFPSANLEIALRYERSDELIDAAERFYGLAVTRRFPGNVSATLEYLKADFKRGFVEEDDDIFARRGDVFALWLAIEF